MMMKKNLLYIGNKLSKHGNNLTGIETLGELLSSEKFNIIFASDKKNPVFRLLDMAFVTIKNCLKLDYVLIDTYSTNNFYYALVISQLCRFFQLKYVPILHGGNLPQRLKQNPHLCSLIFKNAYKNVAPSNYLLSIFSKSYNNLVYIPNTINIENYPFLERKFQEPNLLWVRSFATIYNPKMGIEVLNLLKKEFPNASLCMVGPDTENILEDCKQYAKKLNVEVTFIGKLSKKDWTKLSQKFNIFINTTNFDNTPLSIIEAMALGLPVVSTNVGGIPYLLEDKKTALLVNKNNVEQMKTSIAELFSNQELRNNIIKNAREKSDFFDWNVVKILWFQILT